MQGPAKNTQSLALRMHLRHLALPKFDIRLSSSVMVTMCINLNRSLRWILVMMLCVSAHMRSRQGSFIFQLMQFQTYHGVVEEFTHKITRRSLEVIFQGRSILSDVISFGYPNPCPFWSHASTLY